MACPTKWRPNPRHERTQCAVALFDVKHPQHQEALELLPELLPDGMVVTGRSRDVCLLAA
jgi:hypothetical protein